MTETLSNKEGRGARKSCPSWLGVRNGVPVGLAKHDHSSLSTLVPAFPGLEECAGRRSGLLWPRSLGTDSLVSSFSMGRISHICIFKCVWLVGGALQV